MKRFKKILACVMAIATLGCFFKYATNIGILLNNKI